MERSVISVKDRDRPKNTHGEIGDSVVDRLLLRYLSSHVSRTRHNEADLTHLVIGNSLSKSFDESRHLSGIPRLIHELSRRAFRQQFLRSLLNLFQCAVKTVSKGGQGEQSASVPGQLCPSPRLLRIFINRCRTNVLFEPAKLGSKTFDLLLDVFKFLRPSMSVVRGDHPLDRYLVMLDERVHSAEGGLEGREPIGRLFRNIEEYLCAIHDSLLLC